MGPTNKQKKLLAHIWNFEQKNQFSPSFAEIKTMMGVKSFQSVVDMLNRLEASGWISKEPNKSRSLSLTTMAKEYLMAIDASQILNTKLEIDGFNTNKINNGIANSTQIDHHQSVANTSISYGVIEKSSIPQQLSLFETQHGLTRSMATENQKLTPSFNTVAMQWFGNILDATSTSVVAHTKDFVGNFFNGPLIQFIVLKKLTAFSFGEIIVIVSFCVLILPLFVKLLKDKYVPSN